MADAWICKHADELGASGERVSIPAAELDALVEQSQARSRTRNGERRSARSSPSPPISTFWPPLLAWATARPKLRWRARAGTRTLLCSRGVADEQIDVAEDD